MAAGHKRKKRLEKVELAVAYFVHTIGSELGKERLSIATDLTFEALTVVTTSLDALLVDELDILPVCIGLSNSVVEFLDYLRNGRNVDDFIALIHKLFTFYLNFAVNNPDRWTYSLVAAGPMEVIADAIQESTNKEQLCRFFKDKMFAIPGVIKSCGDYHCQHTLMVLLLNWLQHISPDLKDRFLNECFTDLERGLRTSLFKDFTKYDSDYKSRFFIKLLNAKSSSVTVQSLPCLQFFAGETRVFQAKHSLIDNFWIDFSLNSNRIHCFCSLPRYDWISLTIHRSQIESLCFSWSQNDNDESQRLMTYSVSQALPTQPSTSARDVVCFVHLILKKPFHLTCRLPVEHSDSTSVFIAFNNPSGVEEALDVLRVRRHQCGGEFCSPPRCMLKLLKREENIECSRIYDQYCSQLKCARMQTDESESAETVVSDKSESPETVLPDKSESPGKVLSNESESSETVLPDKSESSETVLPDKSESSETVLPDKSESSETVLSNKSESPETVLPDKSESPEPVLPDKSETPKKVLSESPATVLSDIEMFQDFEPSDLKGICTPITTRDSSSSDIVIYSDEEPGQFNSKLLKRTKTKRKKTVDDEFSILKRRTIVKSRKITRGVEKRTAPPKYVPKFFKLRSPKNQSQKVRKDIVPKVAGRVPRYKSVEFSASPRPNLDPYDESPEPVLPDKSETPKKVLSESPATVLSDIEMFQDFEPSDLKGLCTPITIRDSSSSDIVIYSDEEPGQFNSKLLKRTKKKRKKKTVDDEFSIMKRRTIVKSRKITRGVEKRTAPPKYVPKFFKLRSSKNQSQKVRKDIVPKVAGRVPCYKSVEFSVSPRPNLDPYDLDFNFGKLDHSKVGRNYGRRPKTKAEHKLAAVRAHVQITAVQSPCKRSDIADDISSIWGGLSDCSETKSDIEELEQENPSRRNPLLDSASTVWEEFNISDSDTPTGNGNPSSTCSKNSCNITTNESQEWKKLLASTNASLDDSFDWDTI